MLRSNTEPSTQVKQVAVEPELKRKRIIKILKREDWKNQSLDDRKDMESLQMKGQTEMTASKFEKLEQKKKEVQEPTEEVKNKTTNLPNGLQTKATENLEEKLEETKKQKKKQKKKKIRNKQKKKNKKKTK